MAIDPFARAGGAAALLFASLTVATGAEPDTTPAPAQKSPALQRLRDWSSSWGRPQSAPASESIQSPVVRVSAKSSAASDDATAEARFELLMQQRGADADPIFNRFESSDQPGTLPPYTEPISDPSQLKGIGQISPFYSPPGEGELPDEVPLGEQPYVPRMLPQSAYPWLASDLCYNPLYFEDVALERYGHSYHPLIQPFVSVGKFSGQLAGLPYQMVIDSPRKAMYPLGYYRPGEYAPCLLYQVPWNTEAAAVQAGVVTGLFFLIP